MIKEHLQTEEVGDPAFFVTDDITVEMRKDADLENVDSKEN